MYSFTTNAGTAIRDYRGLSTDVKPTKNVPNGSTWYDIDKSHDVYMFDAENNIWIKQ